MVQHSLRRVAVVGSSGAGKTTLASRLSEVLGHPRLELDALFHQAGWTELEVEEFRSRVAAFARQESWVIDGNYSRSRDLVLPLADTVVWLRMRRLVVLGNVLRRTSGRLLRREELWNGNRESWRAVLSRDPDRSIVRWAWVMHGAYDDVYPSWKQAAPTGQRWIELRSRREVAAFLAQLS